MLAYGWVNPVLAYVMSVLGCLLGIMLAARAQADTGRRRTRLLIYATLALGGAGVWQAHVIALLGFALPNAVPRYDPLLIAVSLAVAVVVVGCGLFVAGLGDARFRRMLVAGTLLGAGVAATHYTAMAAVQVGGAIEYEPVRFAASVAIAMAAACAALWCIAALKGLRSAIIAALVLGAAVVGMHYVGMSAVRVRVIPFASAGESAHQAGVSPMLLIPLVVLLGSTAIAMMWFFTVGTSTVHDLRAIFETPERKVDIEPWMIDEITERIAVGAGPTGTQDEPVTASGPAGNASALPSRLPPGPRPTPGIKPVWLTMPVWGANNRPMETVPYAGSARGSATGARTTVVVSDRAAILDRPERYPPGVNPDPVPRERTDGRRSSRRNRRQI